MWVLILGCSLDNLLVNTNVIIPNINNEMLNGYQIYLVFLIWSIVSTPPKNIENIDILSMCDMPDTSNYTTWIFIVFHI